MSRCKFPLGCPDLMSPQTRMLHACVVLEEINLCRWCCTILPYRPASGSCRTASTLSKAFRGFVDLGAECALSQLFFYMAPSQLSIPVNAH